MTRFVLALLLCAASGLAQAPRIQFSETAWDFGTRDQGSPGETKIVKVENVGVRELRITELDVTCGCVQPHFRGHKPKYFKGAQKLDIALAPGASIDLILDLHTERGEGEIKKFVTVKSNDPTQRVVNLPMTGTLKPRWWIASKRKELTGFFVFPAKVILPFLIPCMTAALRPLWLARKAALQ